MSLDQLREYKQAISVRRAALATEIERIRGEVQTCEDTITGLRTQRDTIQQTVQAITQNITLVQARMERHSLTREALQGTIGEELWIKQQKSLETELAGLRDSLKSSKSELREVTKSVEREERECGEILPSRIATLVSLEDQLRILSEEENAMSAEIGNILHRDAVARIDAVQDKISELQSALIQANIALFQAKNEAVESLRDFPQLLDLARRYDIELPRENKPPIWTGSGQAPTWARTNPYAWPPSSSGILTTQSGI